MKPTLYIRRTWLYPLLAAASAVVFTLATPTASYAFNWFNIFQQGFQVVQLSSMNDQKEVDLGKQIDAQLKSTQISILDNPAATAYVTQIGQRLIPQSARPNLPFTYQIVDDDAVNAFATVGGFVYVNKGLLKIADNEAQLASVIGHEMGHITAKHDIKQMRESAVTQGLLGAAGLDQSQAVQMGVQLAFKLPHSRQDEFEADRRGTRAGYSQIEMVNFMKKLLASASSTPAILNTHPNTADRITQLNRQIQQAPSAGKDGTDPTIYRNRLRSLD
jgi:predicted Zn-dependent protease